MNAKKIKTALLIFFLLAGSFFYCFAENKSQRFVIKTQYFDIIFKAPSVSTANLIAENIDKIYLDLRTSLKTEDYFFFNHFPIYIEYSTDELNAYYTDYPFRHIVVYDTVPDYDLAVFNNNILSILQHELCHAVSLNVKNKFNQTVSNIFYNGLGFAFYSAPKFFTEGIAVQNESEDGFGRLNNPYSMHILKQSIIENKVPKVQELTGARDIYPSGNLPYIFGGAFTQWVIKKYGKKKFNSFLYGLNNQLKNYNTIYKNNFGCQIKDDYNEFIKAQNVFDLDPNPYNTKGIFRFPYKQKKSSRTELTTSFITDSKSATAWYNQDSNQVWISSIENNKSSKPKKLFTMSGIEKISFSSDGHFLAISRIESFATRTYTVWIYDLEKNEFTTFKENYRDATILSWNNRYILVAVKTLSQFCSIDFYEFSSNKKFDLIKTIKCPKGNIPLDLQDAQNLTLAFVYLDNGKESISLYDMELDNFIKVDLPKEIYIRDLSVIAKNSFISGQQGMVLGFSYATKQSLPRLGFLSLKLMQEKNGKNVFSSAKFHLMKKDISGGVYKPSVYCLSKSLHLPSVVFVSRFFDNSKLSVIDTDLFEFEQIDSKIISADNFAIQYPQAANFNFNDEKNSLNQFSDSQNLQKFNPFSYTFRGIFAPFGLVPFYDEQFNIQSLGLVGLTFHSKGYHVSAGFDPLTMAYGISTALFNYSPSRMNQFLLLGTCSFDKNGFRQTEEELSLTSSLPIGKHSYINLSSESKFFYGYSINFPFAENLFLPQSRNLLSTVFVNQELFELSSICKTGYGVHERGGVFAGILFNYTYLMLNQINLCGQGINVGFEFGFKIPSILPFENPNDVTINFPFSLNAFIFPDISRFMSLNASVVLFSKEIQKGTYNFILPLYLNRFYITAKYSSDLYYSSFVNLALVNPKLCQSLQGALYSDSVGLGVVFAITLNTGYLVQLGTLNVSADILYDINQAVKGQNRFHLKLCSQLVF